MLSLSIPCNPVRDFARAFNLVPRNLIGGKKKQHPKFEFSASDFLDYFKIISHNRSYLIINYQETIQGIFR